MKSKIIKQSDLTSDCFPIQLWGLESCEKCQYKNTSDCGGGKTLIKLKKEKLK